MKSMFYDHLAFIHEAIISRCGRFLIDFMVFIGQLAKRRVLNERLEVWCKILHLSRKGQVFANEVYNSVISSVKNCLNLLILVFGKLCLYFDRFNYISDCFTNVTSVSQKVCFALFDSEKRT